MKRALQAFDPEQFPHAATRALAITKQRVGQYLDHRLTEGAAWATLRYEIAVLNADFAALLLEPPVDLRP